MKYEDGTAGDICHTDQATDASTNAKHKPPQHVRVHKGVRKVLTSVRKVATGVGKVAAEGVGVANASCHSEKATDASTIAKHKATQHGGLHYRFWQELTFLQKLFSITNGEVLFFFVYRNGI
jgi:hypothetical protein